MNAAALQQIVSSRIPGYDTSEYLREINTAYQDCWNRVLQLDDSYFTDIKQVAVAQQGSEFDFLYNSNANLAATVSNRYFQINRIRVLLPGDVNWFPAYPRDWNSPDFLQQQQFNPSQPYVAPPYYYVLFAKGSAKFGQVFSAGTTIEVVYTFNYLPLTIISDGSVTTSGNAVTGANTSFTQILGADFQVGLPGNDEDTDVGVELVIGVGGNQTYRVATLTNDTTLTTINAVTPAVSAVNYQLAMVPDIPEGHHELIATLATRNMAISPARDWALVSAMNPMAEKQMEAMADSVMTRQRQEPPRRRRFSQSVLRYFVPSVSASR